MTLESSAYNTRISLSSIFAQKSSWDGKLNGKKMERRALNFEKFLLLRTWKGWVWVVVVYMWKKRVKRGTSFSTNDPGYVLHRCCITTKVYIHPLPTPVKNWKLKTFFARYFPNRSLSLFCPPLCFEWLTFIVDGIWLEGQNNPSRFNFPISAFWLVWWPRR